MDQIDWADKQKEYKVSDWSCRPSLFAEFTIDYLPKKGSVLDLGAGVGQDSVYFAENGFKVTSTDKTVDILRATVEDLDVEKRGLIDVKKLNLTDKFEFNDSSFDVVYAHLSLHYFDEVTTKELFSEIYRVLKPGGVFAFFTNSVNDPEYSTGTEIEKDYFLTEGDTKRYFSVNAAKQFASAFTILVADDQGETYKDMAKDVHNLIRYIGTKPNKVVE